MSQAKLFAIFPGQGTQKVGMASGLEQEFPQVKPLFEEAEDTLRFSLRKLICHGPEEQLGQTIFAQPAVFVTSLAHWQILRQESSCQATFFAGHSLGEISALVAAQILDFAQALELIAKRAHAMHAAYPPEESVMMAIIGLSLEELRSAAEEARRRLTQRDPLPRPRKTTETEKREDSQPLTEYIGISIENSSDQTVVSASRRGTQCFKAVIEERFPHMLSPSSSPSPSPAPAPAPAQRSRGSKLRPAIRCVPLKVSAAFHCPLMRPAKEQLRQTFSEIKFTDSQAMILANVTGELAQPYQSWHLLEQLDHPVLWYKSLQTALKQGATIGLEVGHSEVLSRMWRREPQAADMTWMSSSQLKKCLRYFSQ